MSIIPNTCHASLSGGKTVSELFISIGHLSLIVKDWLMITVHRKTFEGKENVLWAICFLCVTVLKLLVFKISTF